MKDWWCIECLKKVDPVTEYADPPAPPINSNGGRGDPYPSCPYCISEVYEMFEEEVMEEALKQSIEHWERMLKWILEKWYLRFPTVVNLLHYMGQDLKESTGIADCALCKMYIKNAPFPCGGCPVKEVTGRVFCQGTPHIKVVSSITWVTLLFWTWREVKFLKKVKEHFCP